MIRPFTLITMLLAAGSGAYLFAVKHHAQMLDDQIAEISQESRLDALRIQVLQAQWALETNPRTLQQLATRFTDLQPMQPAQLVTLAALKTALPAPGSAAPGANPELPAPAQPAPPAEWIAAASPQNPDVAGALSSPPGPADAAPASAARQRFAGHTPRRVSHSILAVTELAEALPPPRPYAAAVLAPIPIAPPAPIYRTAPIAAQVVPVKATVPTPRYLPATPPVAADSSGSVLGMAAELPPPLPLPQNGFNN